MIPPRQQEKCGHIDVCYEAKTTGPAMARRPVCPYDMGITFKKPCPHDTRSRPLPAQQPTDALDAVMRIARAETMHDGIHEGWLLYESFKEEISALRSKGDHK